MGLEFGLTDTDLEVIQYMILPNLQNYNTFSLREIIAEMSYPIYKKNQIMRKLKRLYLITVTTLNKINHQIYHHEFAQKNITELPPYHSILIWSILDDAWKVQNPDNITVLEGNMLLLPYSKKFVETLIEYLIEFHIDGIPVEISHPKYFDVSVKNV